MPYMKLAEEFHAANPDVTVEVKKIGSYQTLAEGADAFVSGLSLLANINYLDNLQPLDNLIARESAEFVEDYLPQTLDAVRYRGRIIALPAELDTAVIFYNKDLFDEAGIPYPEAGWTWDDFLAAAKAMTKPLSDEVIQYGFIGNSGLVGALPIIAEEVGDEVIDLETFRLDSEPAIRAIERYTDLALLHNVMPERPFKQGQPSIKSMEAVAAGQVAMWLDTVAYRGGDRSGYPPGGEGGMYKWNFPWGAAPLPRVQSGRYFSFLRVYSITNSAANPEDAWRWILFLSDHFEQNVGLPVRCSLLESDGVQEHFGIDQPDVMMQIATESTLGSADWVGIWPVVPPLTQALNDILKRDLSTEEALREAQQKVEDSREE